MENSTIFFFILNPSISERDSNFDFTSWHQKLTPDFRFKGSSHVWLKWRFSFISNKNADFLWQDTDAVQIWWYLWWYQTSFASLLGLLIVWKGKNFSFLLAPEMDILHKGMGIQLRIFYQLLSIQVCIGWHFQKL